MFCITSAAAVAYGTSMVVEHSVVGESACADVPAVSTTSNAIVASRLRNGGAAIRVMFDLRVTSGVSVTQEQVRAQTKEIGELHDHRFAPSSVAGQGIVQCPLRNLNHLRQCRHAHTALG